jgi:hypothetical protein
MASTGECLVRHDWGDATGKLSPDWAKRKVTSKNYSFVDAFHRLYCWQREGKAQIEAQLPTTNTCEAWGLSVGHKS